MKRYTLLHFWNPPSKIQWTSGVRSPFWYKRIRILIGLEIISDDYMNSYWVSLVVNDCSFKFSKYNVHKISVTSRHWRVCRKSLFLERMNVYFRFDCQSFGKQYLIVPPKFDYATKLYLKYKFRYVDTILKISFMFSYPWNVLSN